MKKIIILLLLAVLGVASYYFWFTKPKPNQEAASLQSPAKMSHSPAFNQSVDSVLNAYYALNDAFVNWDSLRVDAHAAQLRERLDQFSIDGLQGDTVIYQSVQPTLEDVRSEAKALNETKGLDKKRKAYHALSQNLYNLLRTVQYDGATVYLQECPMAFNGDGTGNWISKTSAIQNPYLGLHDPKYKSGMLECGETKDSLNFARTQ
jgi:hypothetical protein